MMVEMLAYCSFTTPFGFPKSNQFVTIDHPLLLAPTIYLYSFRLVAAVPLRAAPRSERRRDWPSS